MLRLVMVVLFFLATPIMADDIREQAAAKFGQDWVNDIDSWAISVNDNVPGVKPHQRQAPTGLQNYLDPEHWVNRYLAEKQGQNPAYVNEAKPKLSILVSMSMADESIQQWAKQADEANAQLVLNGFVDNDLIKTQRKAMQLFAKQKVGGFVINPKAFEELGIDRVPAVVIDVSPVCLSEHCPKTVDVVFGNMGLWEALKVLSEKGQPEVSTYAQSILQKTGRV